MYDLSRLFPPTTRFLADNGNSTFWAIHYLHPTPDKHITNISSIRLGMGFLSMGWAIGAAVGTALAVPDTPVVCITGDGSLLMSGQELTVALQQNLSVIFVILNDSALGTVKHGQKLGGRESVGYELPVINFAGYAKAMGVEGHIITSPQDMVNLDIISLCKKAGPTLLDIRIDPFEIPPIEKCYGQKSHTNAHKIHIPKLSTPRSVDHMGLRIISTGSYLPTTIETVQAQPGPETDGSQDFELQFSGGHEHRVCQEHETSTYMGIKAAQDAFANGGIDPRSIDAVISYSGVADNETPRDVYGILNAIGCDGAMAWTMDTACASFMTHLHCANALSMTEIKRILILDSMNWVNRAFSRDDKTRFAGR